MVKRSPPRKTTIVKLDSYEPLEHDGPSKPDKFNKAMELLREATVANKYDDNVLLSPDWFQRAKELCK